MSTRGAWCLAGLLGSRLAVSACVHEPAATGDAEAKPPTTSRGLVYRPPEGGIGGITEDFQLYEKAHAVVIGIDAYRGHELEGAVRDARAVAELLGRQGTEVTLVLDGDATGERLERLLGKELPARLGPKDRVIVYFAGHGWSTPSDNPVGYLVPVDASWNELESSAVPMSDLQKWFAHYPAKHVLFVADACYSGLAIGSRSGRLGTHVPDYLRKVAESRVRMTLVAGSADEEALEHRGHGLFTYFLLRALDGLADLNFDGVVTSDEIAAFVKPNVAKVALQSYNSQQNPQLARVGEGEILFPRSDFDPARPCPAGFEFGKTGCVPANACPVGHSRTDGRCLPAKPIEKSVVWRFLDHLEGVELAAVERKIEKLKDGDPQKGALMLDMALLLWMDAQSGFFVLPPEAEKQAKASEKKKKTAEDPFSFADDIVTGELLVGEHSLFPGATPGACDSLSGAAREDCFTLALAYRDARYKDALEVMNQVADRDLPVELREHAGFYHAQILQDAGSAELAAHVFARLIEIHPGTIYYGHAVMAIGEQRFSEGKMNEALALYEKALGAEHLEPAARDFIGYKVAWAWLNAGEEEKAFVAMSDIVRRKQVNEDLKREALRDLTRMYARVRKPVDALGFFLKLTDAARASELAVRVAEHLFEEGRHKDALIVVDDVLDARTSSNKAIAEGHEMGIRLALVSNDPVSLGRRIDAAVAALPELDAEARKRLRDHLVEERKAVEKALPGLPAEQGAAWETVLKRWPTEP